MKLWVDDERRAPEGWTQARTVTEAIRTIAMFGADITEIALDHDIGHPAHNIEGQYASVSCPENFTAVAYYIRERYTLSVPFVDNWLPKITIHTWNPEGAKEIAHILEGFDVTIQEAKV